MPNPITYCFHMILDFFSLTLWCSETLAASALYMAFCSSNSLLLLRFLLYVHFWHRLLLRGVRL